jgi:uncharacterized protein (DUF4415 family)
MTEAQMAALNAFKTKDYTDCPVQTPEQLREFTPKYPDARLYTPTKKTVQIRLDDDIVEWLRRGCREQSGPEYQTRANAILRQAMIETG